MVGSLCWGVAGDNLFLGGNAHILTFKCLNKLCENNSISLWLIIQRARVLMASSDPFVCKPLNAEDHL